MVGSRFVASLAKPGGNTTGVSLLSSDNSSTPQRLQTLEELIRARGAELSIYRVAKAEEMAGAAISK
jgi:hypothetical protein